MLPENKVTVTKQPPQWYVPERLNQRIDYEKGGIALQNPSWGLNYQLWTLEYREYDHTLVLRGQIVPDIILKTGLVDVISVGLSFDQNMTPIYFYSIGTQTFFNWVTPEGVAQEIILPNIRNPQLSRDEYRDFNLHNADVILSYVSGKQLIVRYQRHRFLPQYAQAIYTLPSDYEVVQVGLTKRMRYEFFLKPTKRYT